jgi:hypothetical protein
MRDDGYPDNWARGISRKKYLRKDSEHPLKPVTFEYMKNRENGMGEISIIWLENREAEEIAKNMLKRNSDELMFILGFAVMMTNKMDEIISDPYYGGDVTYCHAPSHSNPYHGHICIPLKKDELARQLASELADNAALYRYDESLPVG